MIQGVGIDIIEISRIEQIIRYGREPLLRKVFTEKEIEYCESKKRKYEHYAVRFAAKEAFFKALGQGWRDGVSWKDVEVTIDKVGKPGVKVEGKTKELFEEMKAKRALLSLSHSEGYALAQVILESWR